MADLIDDAAASSGGEEGPPEEQEAAGEAPQAPEASDDHGGLPSDEEEAASGSDSDADSSDDEDNEVCPLQAPPRVREAMIQRWQRAAAAPTRASSCRRPSPPPPPAACRRSWQQLGSSWQGLMLLPGPMPQDEFENDGFIVDEAASEEGAPAWARGGTATVSCLLAACCEPVPAASTSTSAAR